MLPSSGKNHELTAAAFARLLARLSDDAEAAGEAYKEQRRMLVKFFECRGCHWAEELADETLDRVLRRLGAGEEIVNIPAYAFGVARLVWLEWARAPEQRRVDFENLPPLSAPSVDVDDEAERRRTCLESCLQKLPAENRALLLEYYRDERRAKIDLRQALAERLGLRRNALTKRVLRLRAKLEACLTGCVKN